MLIGQNPFLHLTYQEGFTQWDNSLAWVELSGQQNGSLSKGTLVNRPDDKLMEGECGLQYFDTHPNKYNF